MMGRMTSTAGDRTADRIEILDLFARYAWALIDRDWETWRGVFTEDATVDYSTAGVAATTPAEAAEQFGGMFTMFDINLSQATNALVTFTGEDSATSRSMYRNVMRIPAAEEGGAPTYMEAQGQYHDTLVRTPAGWRIQHRHEDMAYVRT